MYDQPEKSIARSEVIKSAIKTLTKNRQKATLTPKNHVQKVQAHLIKKGGGDEHSASRLSQKTIRQWERLYDSIVHKKQAKDLRVAYLSGPNPINDLREMTAAGILPENIWAFESDLQTYNDALTTALSSEFPFAKILKANIADFFKISPQKFDIIYLDFCGPLPSRDPKAKTLSTITRILYHHALNSPGIIITNFGLPTPEQDKTGADLLNKLTAAYLYPKPFLEKTIRSSQIKLGAIPHSFTFEKWKAHVSRYREKFYSQFVSTLLIDLVQFIAPYSAFPTANTIFENMFEIKDKESYKKDISLFFQLDENDDGGYVACDPNMNSILWSIATLSSQINKKVDSCYPDDIFTDAGFKAFSSSFLSQLIYTNQEKDLIENISKVVYLLSEGYGEEKYYSQQMKKLSEINYFPGIYHFCDVVLFHQIKEIMLRQLATPYHANIEMSRRWKYKAKDTNMFMDMLVIDECRYLYDWMPNIGTLENSITDHERQLIFRFVLDGISQHRRYYTTEMFFGTACVGHNNPGFNAKILRHRKEINIKNSTSQNKK